MTGEDRRLSATAFMRDYTRHVGRGQLAFVSICLAVAWWLLGCRPVQRWVNNGRWRDD